MAQRRLHHAYLFVGPPNVGKMTLALDLARALECEQEDPAARPCGNCWACRQLGQIDPGAEGPSSPYPDLLIDRLLTAKEWNEQFSAGDAERGDGEGGGRRTVDQTEVGIEQMRRLQHLAYRRPSHGRERLFLIKDAELLSKEAANCLLKSLEEPPPGVRLILLVVNERWLPETIVSRCQRLDLPRLARPLVEATLRERYGTPPEEAARLAWLSGGRLGWAIGARQDANRLRRRADELAQVVRLLEAGSVPDRFKLVAEWETAQKKQSPGRKALLEPLRLWESWWRDLLLVANGASAYVQNVDQQPTLERWAARLSLEQIVQVLDQLRVTTRAIEQNANVRLALEVFTLALPRARQEA